MTNQPKKYNSDLFLELGLSSPVGWIYVLKNTTNKLDKPNWVLYLQEEDYDPPKNFWANVAEAELARDYEEAIRQAASECLRKKSRHDKYTKFKEHAIMAGGEFRVV